MNLATKIAALPEPALGRPRPQPRGTLLSLAPSLPSPGLEDRAMSRASHIFFLLTSLTDNEIDALAPADRQLLQGQLERVHRMVTGAIVVSDVRRAAFLDELRDGQGRE